MNDIQKTLSERQKTHGSFARQAAVSQELKDEVRNGSRYHKTFTAQREAIDMILHKISRLVNGDPYLLDTWRDIIGYAQLGFSATLSSGNATDIKTERIKIDTNGKETPLKN